MAVEKHSSLHPSAPSKPPAARQTEGESGQEGVHYGHRHELKIKDPNGSELSHHFKAHAARSSEGKADEAC